MVSVTHAEPWSSADVRGSSVDARGGNYIIVAFTGGIKASSTGRAVVASPVGKGWIRAANPKGSAVSLVKRGKLTRFAVSICVCRHGVEGLGTDGGGRSVRPNPLDERNHAFLYVRWRA